MRVVAEAAQEDIRNRLMFALAYFGALRREELVSLRVPDIDAAHRLVTVRAETSKTAANRVVSYPACAGRSLMGYLLQRHALDATPGPLFLSVSNRNRGSPLSKWQWSKTVLGECQELCVSERAHAVFRYVQASKRPANIMAS